METLTKSLPILMKNRCDLNQDLCKPVEALGSTNTKIEQVRHDLVNTITEDEDDHRGTSVNSIILEKNDTRNKKYHRESFLDSYGTMMKQQEIEYAVTVSYLRPLLRNLELLAWMENSNNGHGQMITTYYNDHDDQSCLLRELSYAELHRALEKLEKSSAYGYMTADHQFMLTLRMLTRNEQLLDGVNWNPTEDRITWAEIVQCYRICIVGMQALGDIPDPKDTRARARDRSMSMMSQFQPVSVQGTIQPTFVSAVQEPYQRSQMIDSAMKPEDSTISYVNISDAKVLSRIFSTLGALILSVWLLLASVNQITPMEDSISRAPKISDLGLHEHSIVPTVPLQTASSEELNSFAGTVQDVLHATGTTLTSPSSKQLKFATMLRPHPSTKYMLHPSTKKLKNEVGSKSPPTDSGFMQPEIDNSLASQKSLEKILGIGVAAVCAGILVPTMSSASIAMSATVPALYSIGTTVVAATLVAHGLKGLFSNWFQRRFKKWLV